MDVIRVFLSSEGTGAALFAMVLLMLWVILTIRQLSSSVQRMKEEMVWKDQFEAVQKLDTERHVGQERRLEKIEGKVFNGN